LRAHVFGRDQRGRVQNVFLHPDVMLQALRQEGVFGMAFRPRFGAQQLFEPPYRGFGDPLCPAR
jgi:hypothetical protein